MLNMEHMYNFNVSDIRSQEYPMMRGTCLLASHSLARVTVLEPRLT